MRVHLLILTFLFLIICTVPAFAEQVKAAIKGTVPDSAITGEVKITQRTGGIWVQVKVDNVPPGKHGLHFHENGSCEDAGKAAGGHFNPDSLHHGFLPTDGLAKVHGGDMGNIKVNKNGKGKLNIYLPGLTLSEGKYSVVGKSIILHEKEDDFSQPTGNAGGRIGCGIIEEIKTKE